MLLNEKTFERMNKLNLKVFVVDIDNNTVQTFEDWAKVNNTLTSYFCNTSEIGDASEYGVVADNEETARTLAYAEYYEYATRMFLEDLDEDDFEEINPSDITSLIPTTKEA